MKHIKNAIESANRLIWEIFGHGEIYYPLFPDTNKVKTMENTKHNAEKWLRQNHGDHPMLENWIKSVSVFLFEYTEEILSKQ